MPISSRIFTQPKIYVGVFTLIFFIIAGIFILPAFAKGQFKLVATHTHAAKVAEPIKEIVKFNDALYFGYGNQERNEIAPLEVCHYSLKSRDLICDFTFGTSEIRNLKIIDGQLHIPSTDPAETVSYDGYAIYDPATNEWTRISARQFIEDEQNKHDWLVHAVDVAKYNGELWLTDSGAFPKHTHLNRGYGYRFGDIYRSRDNGQTWIRSNIGQPLNYSLFVFKDKLYSPSPMSVRAFAKNRASMVYDGNSWQPSADVILPKPEPEIRTINGDKMGLRFRLGQKVDRGVLDFIREFNGQALILQALHGAHLNRRGKPVFYINHIGNILTATDDLSTPIDNDNIVLGSVDKLEFVNDYTIDGNRVYALMADGQVRYSTDLKKWRILDTEFTAGHPHSIEVQNGEIFIGSDNGRVYQYEKPLAGFIPELRNR